MSSFETSSATMQDFYSCSFRIRIFLPKASTPYGNSFSPNYMELSPRQFRTEKLTCVLFLHDRSVELSPVEVPNRPPTDKRLSQNVAADSPCYIPGVMLLRGHKSKHSPSEAACDPVPLADFRKCSPSNCISPITRYPPLAPRI